MMKPEAQRIAIAKACGWYRLVIEEDEDLPGRYGMAIDQLVPPSGSVCVPIPDYPNDLNAMQKAEKTLSKDLRKQLVFVLMSNVIRDYDKNTPNIDKFRVLYFATAAQRAEAFLKTLGLWKDDS